MFGGHAPRSPGIQELATALLKAWHDAALTRMVYLLPETEGRALTGKPLLIAATAGHIPEAYAPRGANMFSMEALLAPLRATAHRCGLGWVGPFLLYRANKLTDAALAEAGRPVRNQPRPEPAAASLSLRESFR